jgi:alpha-glucoside transport system permease protein
MDPKYLLTIVVLVGVPATVVGYILLTEQLLRLVPHRLQPAIRPWLWIFPATLFLLVFLVYPTINTIVLSFQDRFGQSFIGLENYTYFFTTGDTLSALRNNLIWLALLTFLSVVGGLVIAILLDRVRYESTAKSLVFLPLAISFVGAGVIWKFMFAYRAEGSLQTGTLNGLLTSFGFPPVSWLTEAPLNTVALIVVGAWIWTGFCMVILSAALKSIAVELLEAARMDGASELDVFRHITFPLLLPTIAVVSTTMVITALKAFDVVYVMTNGAYDTEVIANRMYKELFSFTQPSHASAIAVILLLLIVPIMLANIRQFRAQEAVR